MGSRKIMWHQTFNLNCHRRFLTIDRGLHFQLRRLLRKLADASGKAMVRDRPLLFAVGRLSDLLRHVTGPAKADGLVIKIKSPCRLDPFQFLRKQVIRILIFFLLGCCFFCFLFCHDRVYWVVTICYRWVARSNVW